MTPNTITISVSFAVSPQQAPATLQKLSAFFSSDTPSTWSAHAPASAPVDEIVSMEAAPTEDDEWPSIPADATADFRDAAEDNLRRLREGAIPDQGWGGVKDLSGELASLPAETRKVVMRAIANGGHISRKEVYAVLGRDLKMSLKGFTKPAGSLTEDLIARGEVIKNNDLKPLLNPIYKKSKTYQPTQGFTVPIQVVSLMTGKTT